MKNIEDLTQEEVRELIKFDYETGRAFYNERDIKWFQNKKQRAQWACNRWNSNWAGKEITYINADGYVMVGLLGKRIYLHRLIWLREYGEWPDQVDHINGNRSDNRLCNLRNVTNQENSRNSKRNKNNTSGQTGVYFNKRANKWQSYIYDREGNSIYLGLFERFEDAVAVRKAAEIKYGYHERHGRSEI